MRFKEIILKRYHDRQLEQARARIEKAKDYIPQEGNIKVLDLDNLGITDTDLKSLMPEIKKVENLVGISLSRNKLTTLPDDIGDFKDLEYLELKKNKIATLPDRFGELQNLAYLDLGNNVLKTLPTSIVRLINLRTLTLENNKLKSLPDTIGDLNGLVYLRLQNNKLTTLPDTIGEGLQSLHELHLSNNALKSLPPSVRDLHPLTVIDVQNNRRLDDGAMMLLQETFVNLSANRKKSNAEILMHRTYGDDADRRLKELKKLKLGHFEVPQGDDAFKRVKASKVLKEFFKKVPIVGGHSEIVYKPAVESLLKTILDPQKSEEERKMAVQQIATSLGDCGTPVRNFLTQVIIGECRASNEPISEDINNVITAMAVEQAIRTQLKEHITGPERIEIVQALVNSLFLEGADKIDENKVKVTGQHFFLPSGSEYTLFGFTQIKDDLAEEFAKMCCMTNDAGDLFQDEEGRYILDAKKINLIRQPYLAGLGLVSQRERLIEPYKEALEGLLAKYELGEHLDKEDAMELMDTTKHRDDFRAALSAVPDDKLQETFDRYLLQKELEISRLGIEYNRVPKSRLSAMTAVSGISRSASTAALKEVEKHSKRSSEKAEKPSRRNSF